MKFLPVVAVLAALFGVPAAAELLIAPTRVILTSATRSA